MFVTLIIFFISSRLVIGSGTRDCTLEQFRCEDGLGCVDRIAWCDGNYDCSDKSDEMFCKRSGLFSSDPNKCRDDHFKCKNGQCIPAIGRCDGIESCDDASDENDCYQSSSSMLTEEVEVFSPLPSIPGDLSLFRRLELAKEKAKQWILSRMEKFSWGEDTPQAVVALFLADPLMFQKDPKGDLISKNLQSQLMVYLSRNSTNLFSLSSYIQAVLATCQDPSDFHGHDLVASLRQMTDSAQRQSRIVNPFVYLTLCLAEQSTYNDVVKMRDFFTNLGLQFQVVDIQSLVVLAGTCFERSPDFSRHNIKDYGLKIITSKWNQGAEDVYTTALYTQALFAADKKGNYSSNLLNATEDALGFQQEDGSFGDFLATYDMMPVLSRRSWLDLTSGCKPERKIERQALPVGLLNSNIEVRYSLYLGNRSELQHSTFMKVPFNTSLFEVMKIAERQNPLFRFQYDVINGQTKVYSIGSIPNDAEQNMYWVLYLETSNKSYGNNTFLKYNIDIKNYIPSHKDHIIFWYLRL